MNAPVLHRRRIERYAQLLDEASGARRHHARSPIDDELASMLDVNKALTTDMIRLAEAPELAPTDSFRMDARALIMAAAERNGVGRTYHEDTAEVSVSRPAVGRAKVGTIHQSAARRLLPRQRSKPGLTTNRRARGAILVGLAVGTLALSGISAASGDAQPGSALYGMKRSAENAQIALAGSDSKKGQLYLDFARTRLSEAQQLGDGSTNLDSVLAAMDSQTTNGAKLLFTDAVDHKSNNDVAVVDSFVTYQAKQLAGWKNGLSGNARSRALHSIAILDQIHARAQQIHAALSCASSIKIIGKDAYGPEASCQAGASATAPNTTPTATAHHSSGNGNGSSSKTTEKAPTTASKTTTGGSGTANVGVSTTPTSTGASAAASTPAGNVDMSAGVTPDPDPTSGYDGGVLGSIGHLLGGL